MTSQCWESPRTGWSQTRVWATWWATSSRSVPVRLPATHTTRRRGESERESGVSRVPTRHPPRECKKQNARPTKVVRYGFFPWRCESVRAVSSREALTKQEASSAPSTTTAFRRSPPSLARQASGPPRDTYHRARTPAAALSQQSYNKVRRGSRYRFNAYAPHVKTLHGAFCTATTLAPRVP